MPGTADDLRAAVQNSIDTGGQLKQKVSALLALYNTSVTLPNPANSPPNTPQKVVQSPLNDQAKLKELLPKLMDAATTRTSFEIVPRVNVNTAPPEVMAAVPGLTQENIDAIMAARTSLSPDDLATTTGAWLVTQANVPPEVYQSLDSYITGRTMTYRVHSVGYFGKGGPVARVEAVIDTNQGHPRILYYRDVSDLGRGFDLPR
jgi:DNA uptake protein ComE-like DNA-binding protein